MERIGHELRPFGTDVWSWNAPFSHTARRYAETGDPATIREGHKAGRETSYHQTEKLQNLKLSAIMV